MAPLIAHKVLRPTYEKKCDNAKEDRMIYLAILVFLSTAALRFTRLKAYAKYSGACGFLFSLASLFTIVPAGHVGVPVVFGHVGKNAIPEGMHRVNPFANVVKMSVRTLEYTMSGVEKEGAVRGFDAITALSSDGMNVNLEVTVLHRLLAERAAELYRSVGLGYVEVIVRPMARAAIREEAVLFRAEALYGPERLKFVADVREKLHKTLMVRGIYLDDLLLRDVQLPPAIKAAIEAKLKADQEAQQMKFVLLKERQEAERKRIEAQGIADFQATVTKGISEQLLKWKAIEVAGELSKSQNTKIVVLRDKTGLPIILTDK